MKVASILGACVCLLTTITHGGEKREFTSSDGAQKLSAEFVRYDVKRNQVTLRTGTGKNLVSSADKFSTADREYFLQTQKSNDLKSAIRVKTDRDSDREKLNRGQITLKQKITDYTFTIENGSDFDLDGLSLEYWVVVEYDGKPRGEEMKTFNATSKVSSIGARGTYDVKGPTVKLTLGADPGCATCPKVVAAAAAIGRDRIIGNKVVVRDAAGNVLFTEYSSNRIESMFAKND